MKKQLLLITLFITFVTSLFSQSAWSLQLKSKVELRSYRLTNKIEMAEASLAGATITLYIRINCSGSNAK
jgi:hypothetical protein